MKKVLIILCPPRSFSSVISTMVGQHPELYAFPELHLFSADTVAEMIETKSKRGKIAAPGLLRTIAQEHYGVQSTEAILDSIAWLVARKDWSTEKLFHYLLDLISPKIGVEKTPNTCKRKKSLARAYDYCPSAYFLHLTRHPVSTRQSITDFALSRFETNRNLSSSRKGTNLDGLWIWYYLHQNIINFTKTLPVGQTMRIKGEDVLSQPDIYLPQIATWLGVSSEAEAIASMKHPEKSPYAYVGPSPCWGGNDPKFMVNPTLRSGAIEEPSLVDFLEQEQWQGKTTNIPQLADYRNLPQHQNPEQLTQEMINLANLLGYQ